MDTPQVSPTTFAGYTILSFLPRPSGSDKNAPSFKPYAIRRERDGEVFTIGDRFVVASMDDVEPSGVITGFDMLGDSIFIEHTWSGVGFGMDMIEKNVVPILPSAHQNGDPVRFVLVSNDDYDTDAKTVKAIVKGVHFFPGKVKYDLELRIGKEDVTRIYNIDSAYVHPVKK